MDKKQTSNPAALWWRDRRAGLSASVPQYLSGEKLVRPWAFRNPLIIKPHPAQSCLVKPTSQSTNPVIDQSPAPIIHSSIHPFIHSSNHPFIQPI
jgi:hypothetical protein